MERERPTPAGLVVRDFGDGLRDALEPRTQRSGRDRQGDGGAFAGGAFDFEGAADTLGAFAHGAETEVAGEVARGIETLAIVDDTKPEDRIAAG